jgi:hypothetical protein
MLNHKSISYEYLMACKLLIFRLRPIVLQQAHSDNYLVPFRALKLSDNSRKLLAALKFVVYAQSFCKRLIQIIILNMVITWISWGAAPGYIKIAPKGLFKAFQSDFCFSKSPVCSLLEYIYSSFAQ